jgi:hypothetical protein
MSLFSTLIADCKKVYAFIQTAAGQAVVAGHVATVGIQLKEEGTDQPASGAEKHFAAAKLLADFLKVSEAAAHMGVKALIDMGVVAAPVLTPFAEQLEQVADGVIDSGLQAAATKAATVFGVDTTAPSAPAPAAPAPTPTPQPRDLGAEVGPLPGFDPMAAARSRAKQTAANSVTEMPADEPGK